MVLARNRAMEGPRLLRAGSLELPDTELGPSPRRGDPLVPRVPARLWVVSLGVPRDRALGSGPCPRVIEACARVVLAAQRRAAARAGIPGPVSGGGVSASARVGSREQVHVLTIDGVDVLEPEGVAVLHPLAPPRRRDLLRAVAELRAALSLAGSPRLSHRPVAGPVVRPLAPAPSGSAGPPPRRRLLHPFSDGTTHIEVCPRAMVERLAALGAGELRPPFRLHGVLAAGAFLASRCAGCGRAQDGGRPARPCAA